MRTTRRQLVKGGSALAASLALGKPAFSLAQGKTTINWWHIQQMDPGKTDWQKVADDYMAANSNVEIKITVLENQAFKDKMTTAMQSGSPPDLFHSWGGGVLYEYASANLVKDLTED